MLFLYVFANVTKGRWCSIASLSDKDLLICHAHNCFTYDTKAIVAKLPGLSEDTQTWTVSQADSAPPPKPQTETKTCAMGVHLNDCLSKHALTNEWSCMTDKCKERKQELRTEAERMYLHFTIRAKCRKLRGTDMEDDNVFLEAMTVDIKVGYRECVSCLDQTGTAFFLLGHHTAEDTRIDDYR